MNSERTQQAHLELRHRNPDTLERVLNQIALSNSIAGKYAPMQVVKQLGHGISWLQQPMNKNVTPFKQTIINS